MKGGTVQINWHDTKPVLTLDFHPLSATLATGGADYDIKVLSLSLFDSLIRDSFSNFVALFSSFHLRPCLVLSLKNGLTLFLQDYYFFQDFVEIFTDY